MQQRQQRPSRASPEPGPSPQSCDASPPPSSDAVVEVNGITPGFSGYLGWWRTSDQLEEEGVGAGADNLGGIGAGSFFHRLSQARVTATLDDGTVLGPGFTDRSGFVTIRPGRTYKGGIRIQFEAVEGTTYFDSVKCAEVSYPVGEKLRVHVDRILTNIGVTPLTEAAVRLAETASIPAAQANDAVGDAFNRVLLTDFRLDSITLIPSFRSDDGAEVRYAALMAALPFAARLRNPSLAAPGLRIAEQIAADLADGRLDGAREDGTSLAAPAESAYVINELPGHLAAGIRAATGKRVTAYPAIGSFGLAGEYSATVDSSGVLHILPGATPVRAESLKIPGVSGLYSDGKVLFVRSTDGTVSGAGTNDNGRGFFRFGQSAPAGSNSAALTPLPALNGLLAFAQGPDHYLGLRNDGSIVGWGFNTEAQMGPSPGPFPDPVSVGAFDVPAKAIAAGRFASYALLTNGRVMSIGSRWTGQSPVLRGVAGLVKLASNPDAPLDRVVAITATADTVVAVRTDGSVWAWGGDTALTQTEAEAPLAVRIDGLSNITKVTRTYGGMVALDATGSVFFWGRNLLGDSRQAEIAVATSAEIWDTQERGGDVDPTYAQGSYSGGYWIVEPGVVAPR